MFVSPEASKSAKGEDFSLYWRLKWCSADFSRVLTFEANYDGDCSTPGGVNFQPLLTCNLYYSANVFHSFYTKKTTMKSKCIKRKVVLLFNILTLTFHSILIGLSAASHLFNYNLELLTAAWCA